MDTYSPEDLDQIERFLRDPSMSKALESWIQDWVAGHLMATPITQLLGHSSTTFRIAASVSTEHSTTSATFVDLTSVGPTLSQLANGRWLAFWGCLVRDSGGVEVDAAMGISLNAGAASDTHAAHGRIAANGRSGVGYARHFGVFGAPALTSAHNNELKAKYRRASGSGTPNFSNRWLVAIRTGDV